MISTTRLPVELRAGTKEDGSRRFASRKIPEAYPETGWRGDVEFRPVMGMVACNPRFAARCREDLYKPGY